MLTFDISKAPPTRQEIQAEKDRLVAVKKRLLAKSIASDCGHGLALLCLYYFELLNGYGLLAIIGIGTVLTVVLATTLKERLSKAGVLSVFIVALAAAVAIAVVLSGLPGQTLPGAIASGAITASIIVFSTLIGRQLLKVYNGHESLKNLLEFAGAEAELRELCRVDPACEAYRQQALQILRPNLTLGELQAMSRLVNKK